MWVIVEFGGVLELVYLLGGVIGVLLDEFLIEMGISLYCFVMDYLVWVVFVVYEESSGIEYCFVFEGLVVFDVEFVFIFDFIGEIVVDYVVVSGLLLCGVLEDIYVCMLERFVGCNVWFVVDMFYVVLKVMLDCGGVFLFKLSIGEL